MADNASTPHEPLDGPTVSLIEPGWDSHDSTYTDTPPESGYGHDKPQYATAPWDICWHDRPVTALSLFLIGLICAIGQHVFYSMKDGTLAERQEWTLRIGTALAYLLGFSMAALVGISRDQWVWRTLRTRFFPLESIDALFGVTTNVFCFLDFNMVCNAKVSTMLAALKWLFPLVTIFTPSTISVVLRPVDSEFPCNVPTLLFPGPDNGSSEVSTATAQGHDLIYGNYTVIFPPENPGHQLVSKECSVNCSYTYSFIGPSVNCTEFEVFPEIFSKIYEGISDKNIILFGAGQGSDLNTTDIDVNPANNTAADDMLYSSERLWAFHSSANDSCLPRDERSLHAYTCEFGPAQYWINQSISDRPQQPHIKVGPIDKEGVGLHGKATCALLQALREILGGYLIVTYSAPLFNQTQEKNYTVTVPIASNRTNIRSTNLTDETGLNVRNPLGDHIATMAHKMIVSLIADVDLGIAGKVETTCYRTKMQNTYLYKPFVLILVNTLAMFFSALVAVLGALALVENGVASDTSFSTFLRTTRNPTLDRELRGGCLGGSSFRKEFTGLKLKYGELSVTGEETREDGARHVGMGVEGEVSTMKKGRSYY
ncbi:hypothetical protein DFP73DRAFT_474573 [Morchella snyderi]|nr:hypothetical protein DFP73DRAFT_474573 [Morchella snyderi]